MKSTRLRTVSELAESSGEFPDVVEPVGEPLAPRVAKYTVLRQPRQLSLKQSQSLLMWVEARLPAFAKYSALSVSESELVELISSEVVKYVGGARPETSPPDCSGVGPVQGQVPESVQGGR